MEYYQLVVVRNREKKVLLDNLTHDEAKMAKIDWSTIYCSDVYFDPVPVLLIQKQVSS